MSLERLFLLWLLGLAHQGRADSSRVLGYRMEWHLPQIVAVNRQLVLVLRLDGVFLCHRLFLDRLLRSRDTARTSNHPGTFHRRRSVRARHLRAQRTVRVAFPFVRGVWACLREWQVSNTHEFVQDIPKPSSGVPPRSPMVSIRSLQRTEKKTSSPTGSGHSYIGGRLPSLSLD